MLLKEIEHVLNLVVLLDDGVVLILTKPSRVLPPDSPLLTSHGRLRPHSEFVARVSGA